MTLSIKKHTLRSVAIITLALSLFALTSCTNKELAAIGADLVNKDRTAHGLPRLSWDQNAADKAQAWAEHLAAVRRLSHSNITDGISGRWTVLGENVGYAQSVEEVEALYMKSAPHREAILNPRFTSVGVGAAQVDGDVYIVQVFRG